MSLDSSQGSRQRSRVNARDDRRSGLDEPGKRYSNLRMNKSCIRAAVASFASCSCCVLRHARSVKPTENTLKGWLYNVDRSSDFRESLSRCRTAGWREVCCTLAIPCDADERPESAAPLRTIARLGSHVNYYRATKADRLPVARRALRRCSRGGWYRRFMGACFCFVGGCAWGEGAALVYLSGFGVFWVGVVVLGVSCVMGVILLNRGFH